MNEKDPSLVELYGLGWGWQYTRQVGGSRVALTIRRGAAAQNFEGANLELAAADALAWVKQQEET